MRARRTEPRQIAALLGVENEYGRRVLQGIHLFVRDREDVAFAGLVNVRDPDAADQLRLLHADGMVANLAPTPDARAVLGLGLPIVNTANGTATVSSRLAQVTADDLAVGEEAALYFLERGFHRFAYCGPLGNAGGEQRLKGFAEGLRQAGYDKVESLVIPVADRGWSSGLTPAIIDPWLRRLPDSTALFCYNDLGARRLVDAGPRIGRFIPDDIAVLGVDNDELYCNAGRVTLSSVNPGASRIGYAACAALMDLMSGRDGQAASKAVAPLGVVTRASTEIVACDSPVVRRAMVFIRDHVAEPLCIRDVASRTHVSRRTLEVAFHRELHCSPYEMVLRLRAARARTLLSETDLTLAEIAERCGFSDEQHLSRMFRKKAGATPGAYRREHRLR